MIGLLTLQAVRQAGAERVFVVDVDDTRLELALQLGATETFNSKKQDVVAEIQKRTSDAERMLRWSASASRMPSALPSKVCGRVER